MKNNNEPELMDRVVSISRVAKTVKGGRNVRFQALVVVGDGHGRVGAGIGKSIEIPEAIRKAKDEASKNMITVKMNGTTIPHRIMGQYGAGKVLLMPAAPGTGVISGGAVRAVMELSGVKDIRSKSYGTSNPINVVNATLDALAGLMSVEDVAKIRGKNPEDIL